jgi:hypothetical protein
MSDRQALVDQLIDHGLQLSSATDWSLTLPADWVADLPLDGDTLTRPVDNQRAGYFRSPVYRGRELVAQPLMKTGVDLDRPGRAACSVVHEHRHRPDRHQPR